MPWMFNYSGKPHLTQKWVRAICNEFYGTEGVHGYGYGQDEDQGQLGAWYVMSAMGLFDVQGGAAAKPVMQIASSLFDKVEIKLNKKYYKGSTLEIVTRNNGAGNIYLHQPTFNGKKLRQNSISFAQLTQGGEAGVQVIRQTCCVLMRRAFKKNIPHLIKKLSLMLAYYHVIADMALAQKQAPADGAAAPAGGGRRRVRPGSTRHYRPRHGRCYQTAHPGRIRFTQRHRHRHAPLPPTVRFP